MTSVANTHNLACTHALVNSWQSLPAPYKDSIRLNIQAVNHFRHSHPIRGNVIQAVCLRLTPLGKFFGPSSTLFSVHLIPAVYGSYSGESFLPHVHFTLELFVDICGLSLALPRSQAVPCLG